MRRPLSPSALRRTAARLRAGEIVPDNPALSPLQFADEIEEVATQQLMLRSVVLQGREFRTTEEWAKWERQRRRRLMTALREVTRRERLLATFHSLKESPEARDPESLVAEVVRHIHREQRKAQGRVRRRRKK